MKIKISIITGFLFVLMAFCSCNNKKEQTKENEEDDLGKYALASYHASLSDINETKLFEGFQFGMTPNQVDSVFNIWVKEQKVIRFDEAGKSNASVDPFYSDAKIDTYAYRYDVGLPYTLDIMFTPRYLEDKLVSLYCSIKTPKENMNPKEVYKFLADAFEVSERGKGFQKFIIDTNNIHGIIFIKDNLEINFYPQPQKEESSIVYNNVPLMKKYENQASKKIDPARSL